jgi:hypothetical protein
MHQCNPSDLASATAASAPRAYFCQQPTLHYVCLIIADEYEEEYEEEEEEWSGSGGGAGDSEVDAAEEEDNAGVGLGARSRLDIAAIWLGCTWAEAIQQDCAAPPRSIAKILALERAPAGRWVGEHPHRCARSAIFISLSPSARTSGSH